MKAAGLCALLLFCTTATAGAIEQYAPSFPAEIAPRHLAVAPCGAAGCPVGSHDIAAPAVDAPGQTTPPERTVFLQRSGSTVIVTSLGRKGPDKSRRVVVLEDGSAAADPAPCPELVIC
jgi:hypothetical protein